MKIGLRQSALDPGFHGVPPVRHARTVMLMVPTWHARAPRARRRMGRLLKVQEMLNPRTLQGSVTKEKVVTGCV
jgi:hypothetical protein